MENSKANEAAAEPPLDCRVGRRAHRGRVCRRLAALLQRSFPCAPSGLALTWEPENLYPASGSYRTNVSLDCMRWEGFARHYRPDGTFFTVWSVGSYIPMSELVRAKELTISESGEVYPVTSNA